LEAVMQSHIWNNAAVIATPEKFADLSDGTADFSTGTAQSMHVESATANASNIGFNTVSSNRASAVCGRSDRTTVDRHHGLASAATAAALRMQAPSKASDAQGGLTGGGKMFRATSNMSKNINGYVHRVLTRVRCRLGREIWLAEYQLTEARASHLDMFRHWRAARCSALLGLLALICRRGSGARK